ncbi:hypothetical protein D3C72_996190 [compost metagenome]
MPTTLTGKGVRKRQTPPILDTIIASVNTLFFQAMSTVKFPLALIPLIVPADHSSGRAGNK